MVLEALAATAVRDSLMVSLGFGSNRGGRQCLLGALMFPLSRVQSHARAQSFESDYDKCQTVEKRVL